MVHWVGTQGQITYIFGRNIYTWASTQRVKIARN